ncbi:MAG TPA: alpha/beta hydrolase-fold protein [Candidatus Polarisedimenticolaceae bacterium]|nr:alpha/beta hydrolase-fold protein [Candidatus Polarisedimenticolaceae bacterium]
MSARLAPLLSRPAPDEEAIRAFLRSHEFPLVDGGDVTFVYRGPGDAIHLRHWIYALPSSQPFHRVPDTDLWHVTLALPSHSRIEYKIERVIGDLHELILDPLNPRTARDPFGVNSVCHGAGYETPDWTQLDHEARPGSFEDVLVHSRELGGPCAVRVYLPGRFRRRRRYPLLVVHDGRDYLQYAALRTVLDNLIHRLEVAPLIVALTQSADRLVEYAADPRHARFLKDELVPLLEAEYPLIPRGSARGLMGASFGAVAALSAAWYHPGFFGRLLLQSGSFAFSDIGQQRRGPAFDRVAEFVNGFRERPGRPVERIFASCGIYESLIYENRSLVPLLQASGMDVRYVEARDGHNWENWRDRLREGLSWLFPGPLWMVYE